MAAYEPSKTTGVGTPRVEVLSGNALDSILKVLPEGVAPLVESAVSLQWTAAGGDESKPNALWITTICVDHHTHVLVGHEDPVSHTSVFDGETVTTQPC